MAVCAFLRAKMVGITSREGFLVLLLTERWCDWQECIEDGAVVMILANKLDLVEEGDKLRAVSTATGQSLAAVITFILSITN